MSALKRIQPAELLKSDQKHGLLLRNLGEVLLNISKEALRVATEKKDLSSNDNSKTVKYFRWGGGGLFFARS